MKLKPLYLGSKSGFWILTSSSGLTQCLTQSLLVGFLLLLTPLPALASLIAINDNNNDCQKWPRLESAHALLVTEINLARTQPARYADWVADYFSSMSQSKIYIKEGTQYKTQEGWSAVQEAVAFLKQARPVAPLKLSRCLSAAALQHVADQGPRGQVGHQGSDGSDPSARARRYVAGIEPYCGENISYGARSARDVVIQLLVDDGVPGRGHRKNLFNPSYQSVGVATGQHTTYGYMTVHLMCLNPVKN